MISRVRVGAEARARVKRQGLSKPNATITCLDPKAFVTAPARIHDFVREGKGHGIIEQPLAHVAYDFNDQSLSLAFGPSSSVELRSARGDVGLQVDKVLLLSDGRFGPWCTAKVRPAVELGSNVKYAKASDKPVMDIVLLSGERVSTLTVGDFEAVNRSRVIVRNLIDTLDSNAPYVVVDLTAPR